MSMNNFSLGTLGLGIWVCSVIYACICVGVCMHPSLSNCVYACVFMLVWFKSIEVPLSFMFGFARNLSGDRLPEADFFKK